MRKVVGLCLLLVLPVAFASCAGFAAAPVMPPAGFIYSQFSAPLSLDMEASMGSKTGMSKANSILGLIAMGDCSVKAAADAGNIRTVKHLDYKFMNILGIYAEFTTVAYGD